MMLKKEYAVVSFLCQFNFLMPFSPKLYVKDLVGSVLQTADGFWILQTCDTDSLKHVSSGHLDQRPLASKGVVIPTDLSSAGELLCMTSV